MHSDQEGAPEAHAGRSALVEAAYAHLRTLGEPVPLIELAGQAFRSKSVLPPSLLDELRGKLIVDVRFHGDDGSWGLVEWHLREQHWEDVDFVAFDVETNGGRSGRHRIIELGAVRFKGQHDAGTFQSLASLDGKIPQFVTELTGISTEMLEDAPPITGVLEEFAEFSRGAILVAHNLAADLSYINHEAIWAGLPYFPGDGLDTMELHSALLPEVGQVSLMSALSHFGESEPGAHRALADAVAVRKLLGHFFRMAGERGATTVREVHELTLDDEGKTPLARRRRELARWASLSLPALPGVYVFRGRRGDGLYVGKSNSLQRRVRSHFTAGRGYSQKWDALLEETAYIDHEVAGSDLAAILREDELIRDLQPPYNVQLARRPSARIVRLGPADDPVVGCVRRTADDGAIYAGPYRSANDARALVAAVRQTFGLPSRQDRFEVKSDLPRQAAAMFLSHGKELAGDFLRNERERDRDVVEGILGRMKRIRLRSRPVPGGLAGVRVVSIHHGLQPGEVEFRLISSGVIHDMRSLMRPTRSEVREVLDAYREMRPVREKVRSESRENLLLAWVHQRYGDDAIAVLDGEGGNGRIFGRVWRRVRVLTRN
jgi:DNA polymerase-3 subunit epsilon